MQAVDERYIAVEIDRDEIVAVTLREWFSHRPSLRDVTVAISQGSALLKGSVVSERDRLLAVELAVDARAEHVEDSLIQIRPRVA
jgi:hypothetical protein